MNNTISLNKTRYGYAIFFAAALLLLAGMIFSVKNASASTFAPITAQMGVGSTGTNVTNLQTFLGSDRYIYPEGRVTGNFGGLTKLAVAQFQGSYAIPMIGYVGPMTLAKINSVINAGYGIDVYAPSIYNVNVTKTVSSATFNWATSESAGGKVYYSTSPFGLRDATGPFMEPTVSGGNAMPVSNMQGIQSLTLNNLQSHTVYYYIIEAQDASGNVSVTMPSTFMTN